MELNKEGAVIRRLRIHGPKGVKGNSPHPKESQKQFKWASCDVLKKFYLENNGTRLPAMSISE